jgi:hypothetical protein
LQLEQYSFLSQIFSSFLLAQFFSRELFFIFISSEANFSFSDDVDNFFQETVSLTGCLPSSTGILELGKATQKGKFAPHMITSGNFLPILGPLGPVQFFWPASPLRPSLSRSHHRIPSLLPLLYSLILLGIVKLYEGHTICYPDDRGSLKVLATGSDNTPGAYGRPKNEEEKEREKRSEKRKEEYPSFVILITFSYLVRRPRSS